MFRPAFEEDVVVAGELDLRRELAAHSDEAVGILARSGVFEPRITLFPKNVRSRPRY